MTGPTATVATPGDWPEVADDVFVRAYDHLDLNICVVRGGDDLLLVDSRSSPTEAGELAADLSASTRDENAHARGARRRRRPRPAACPRRPWLRAWAHP